MIYKGKKSDLLLIIRIVPGSMIRGIQDFMNAGASMGHLWLEGRFGLGDPLVNAGVPQASAD